MTHINHLYVNVLQKYFLEIRKQLPYQNIFYHKKQLESRILITLFIVPVMNIVLVIVNENINMYT